jgi:hypothetical protein
MSKGMRDLMLKVSFLSSIIFVCLIYGTKESLSFKTKNPKPHLINPNKALELVITTRTTRKTMVSELLNSEPTGYNIVQKDGEWVAFFNSHGLPHIEMVADSEEEIKSQAHKALMGYLNNRKRKAAQCCDMLRHEMETLVALGCIQGEAKTNLIEALGSIEAAASFAQSDVAEMDRRKK